MEVAGEVISIDNCRLDGIGIRGYRRYAKGKYSEVVVGIARYKKKSEADQEMFRID